MVETDFFNVFNVVRIFSVVMIAFSISLFLTPLWTKFLYKYKIGKQLRGPEDAPVFHNLHQHKEGTPTMGGVLIWGTVALVTLGFWFTDYNFLSRSQTWLPLGVLIVAGILGAIDDLFGVVKRGPNGGGLQMLLRILLYLLIALGGAWWFYAKLEFDSINVPFLGDVFINGWYLLFFIMVIVSTAFSANETDGLDGLAGGIFLTMFAAYGVIAFDQGRLDLVIFIGAIIGSLIAFLWFNIFPAKFFMGDTGSMALGITLGVVAMLTNTTLLLPLFAAILVLESLSVLVQLISKKLRGKKIFLSAPIHHHFEALGWHESQVTMRFWIISAMASALGLVLFFLSRVL